jgi:hypothetical protein
MIRFNIDFPTITLTQYKSLADHVLELVKEHVEGAVDALWYDTMSSSCSWSGVVVTPEATKTPFNGFDLTCFDLDVSEDGDCYVVTIDDKPVRWVEKSDQETVFNEITLYIEDLNELAREFADFDDDCEDYGDEEDEEGNE